MGHWLFAALLFLVLGWGAHEYNEDRAPARREACIRAGGDGRYEVKGAFTGLWCAHEDGTLFPVLDPPRPPKEASK